MEIKKEIQVSSELHENLVWAQMRYCSYWPARIVDAPPELGRTPLNKTCVLFFGTKQFGFVELNKIKDYKQNRNQLIKKGRGAAFNEAIKQMDEFISNPNKFHSNAFVKPVGMKIRIKTEHDIKKNLNIKQENHVRDHVSSNNQNANFTRTKTSTNDQVAEDKQKLINTCITLKAENQKLTLSLKKKSDECVNLITEVKKLKQEDLATTETVKRLKLDLEQVKTELADKTDKYEQRISVLVHERKTLEAREKQFQKEVGREARKQSAENKKENIFEVEKVLDDKIKGKMRYFLVRWKGFAPENDTWEKESNLMCPTILKEYFQTKQ